MYDLYLKKQDALTLNIVKSCQRFSVKSYQNFNFQILIFKTTNLQGEWKNSEIQKTSTLPCGRSIDFSLKKKYDYRIGNIK